MKKNSIGMAEKSLKSCLKGKLGITTATVVAFMITGVVAFGATSNTPIGYYDGQSHVHNDDIVLTEDFNNQASLNVYGENTEVIMDGNITVDYGKDNYYGSDLHPRGIQVGNKAKVTNNGTITTTGGNSEGANAWNAEFVNGENGIIITDGENSEGILGSDNATIVNDGTIETSGEQGKGMIVWDNSEAINNGTIETEGFYSAGMLATSNGIEGNNTLINNGNISTKGDNSSGIMVTDNSSGTNNGDISTEGYRSYGMRIESSKGENSETGDIVTNGEKGYGVYLAFGSEFKNEGSITTNGDKSHGIRAFDDGSNVVNIGNVNTTGTTSSGMTLGFGATGVNNGKLNTTGTNSKGASVSTYKYDYDYEYSEEANTYVPVLLISETESELMNRGVIKTTGENSTGVEVFTYYSYDEVYELADQEGWKLNDSLEKGSKFENSGTVETTGNNSFGIYAYTEEGLASSEVYNYEDGIVKTTGDKAIGAYVDNSILVNEGTIETFGDNAYGVYADNSSIDNSGTIQTHGDNSFGIYAVNNSTVNHTGKIYVADEDAYGIVVDQTSTLTVSEDAVIEVGGNSSNGIHVITTNQSEDEVMTMSVAVETERASLTNDGSITATGKGSNAIVLQDADFVNTGTVSSESGYAIVSSGGDNTVTLTETSNIDGIIAGGSGNDTLYLDGTNTDDFDVVAYESIVKTGGGTWTLEGSTIELEASKEIAKVSSYAEATEANDDVDGEIVIGDNTSVSIAVDGEGNSGQIVASEIKVEGDIKIDVNSSNNNGANEIAIDNILVTEEDGLDIDDLGEVTMVSDGWESDYTVNEDGTVDAIITRNAYTERVNNSFGEVASVLENNYTSDVSDDMRLVMNELNDLSNEEFNNGLEQISGNLYTSNVFLTNEVSKQFERNIRGFMNAKEANNSENSSRTTNTENKQHMALIGGTSSYDGNSSTTGFDSDSYGFIGATELSNGFGFSYGYMNTSVDYDDKKESNSDIETFHGGLFHKYKKDGFRLNTNLAFDYSKNDVNRKISFGDIDRKASSDFDSYAVSLGTELRYDFYVGDFVVTPKTGFTYSRIEQDSISESGADSLNLNMDSESYDSIRTNVGVDIAKYVDVSYGTYKFALTGEWVHEFGDIYDDQDASIEGADGDFKIEGLNVSENTYRVGTQVELARTTGTTYFAGYTYEAESSYDNHMGTIGAKFTF